MGSRLGCEQRTGQREFLPVQVEAPILSILNYLLWSRTRLRLRRPGVIPSEARAPSLLSCSRSYGGNLPTRAKFVSLAPRLRNNLPTCNLPEEFKAQAELSDVKPLAPSNGRAGCTRLGAGQGSSH